MGNDEARALGGSILAVALLVGTGGGVAGQALAGTVGRRADMLAAGVDTMIVGTARQVERLKRLRLQKP